MGAKIRCPVLLAHSTSNKHGDGCWGPTMRLFIISKLLWGAGSHLGENTWGGRVLLWVQWGWLERVKGYLEGLLDCLCIPLTLAVLPWEQIIGCAQCSWPSPDVSPRVLAIDGWGKNSPCFPVYARRLPLRSSWIKTAGLDKIAFLFIALGTSMVMVERGWVD